MANGNEYEAFTDATWAFWEPLIKEVRPRGKTPPKELRRTISAIIRAYQKVAGAKEGGSTARSEMCARHLAALVAAMAPRPA